MQVQNLMTRDVFTVTMDDTLAHVREVFQTHQFHHLVVVDGQRLVGIVSDRDLLRSLSPFVGTRAERHEDAFLLRKHVHQIMTRTVVSVNETTPVKQAVALLLHSRVTCLPVVDDQHHLRGIVTWHDMLRYLLDSTVEADGLCGVAAGTPAAAAASGSPGAKHARPSGGAALPAVPPPPPASDPSRAWNPLV